MRGASLILGLATFVVGCRENSPKTGYTDPETGQTIPFANSNDNNSASRSFTTLDPQLPNKPVDGNGPIQISRQAFDANVNNYLGMILRMKDPKDRQLAMDEGYSLFEKSPEFITIYAEYSPTQPGRFTPEQLYKEALKLDAHNPNVLAKYGIYLVKKGMMDAADSYLSQVDPQFLKPYDLVPMLDIQVQVYFEHLAAGSEFQREESIYFLINMVKNRHFFPKINFEPYVKLGQAKKCFDREWLQRLADVCNGKSNVSVLDGWEATKHAKIRPRRS